MSFLSMIIQDSPGFILSSSSLNSFMCLFGFKQWLKINADPEPWSSRRTKSKLLNMNNNTKKKRCENQNVTAHAKRRKQGILELQIIVCLMIKTLTVKIHVYKMSFVLSLVTNKRIRFVMSLSFTER